LWLLVINYPVLVIDHILVEMFGATLQVDGDEPLVSEVVELHVVADLPGVHGPANLHFLVSGASVVQHEHLGLFGVLLFVESAHDGVDFKVAIWGHEAAEWVSLGVG